MNTKLTISIEQRVIEQAKAYAKKTNRSLSALIENYLKAITQETSIEPNESHSPIVSSLKGSFKMPAGFDYKKELEKRRENKYLK